MAPYGQEPLLAVFAHPDDESFGTGGTLSLYARRGHPVYLVCATRGEVGDIADPSLARKENLGHVREMELRCAAQEMGVTNVFFLDYRDSGMAGTPENNDPRCLYRADRAKVIGEVVRIIRLVRPAVVITFEPNGGYGHPDHITIHQVTTAAFSAAGDPTQYPEHRAEGLSPWRPQRLYYTALPRRFFQAMAERLKAQGVDTSRFALGNRGQGLETWGMPDEWITAHIDVSSVVDAKYAAIACHRTQLNPKGPFGLLMSMPRRVWAEPLSHEFFIRAQPAPQPGVVDTDLFSGLS